MMPVIVSFSEVFKWQTCRRQYYYRHILGLSPLQQSDAIDTGVKGHKLLENFYRYLGEGKTKEEARALVTASAQEWISKESFADFSLLKAWTLVDNYIADNEFTAETFLVENRFLIPASKLNDDPVLEGVQIGFTPDLGLVRKGGYLDVEDYKFVQKEWSKKKKNRFPQTKLYQIFLEHMNYDISRTLIRFFNVTTAKVSIQPYVLEAAEKKSLTNDFMAGVMEVAAYKRSEPYTLAFAPRTMNYTACQFCQYEFVCSLEAQGKDATKTFDNEYDRSSGYDYAK